MGVEEQKAACGGTRQRPRVGREGRGRWAEAEQDEKIKDVEVEERTDEKVMGKLGFEEDKERKGWTEELQGEVGSREEEGEEQGRRPREGS